MRLYLDMKPSIDKRVRISTGASDDSIAVGNIVPVCLVENANQPGRPRAERATSAQTDSVVREALYLLSLQIYSTGGVQIEFLADNPQVWVPSAIPFHAGHLQTGQPVPPKHRTWKKFWDMVS